MDYIHSMERTMPYQLTYPYEYEHTVSLDFLDGWPVEPFEDEVQTAGFEYETWMREVGNSIEMYYRYETRKPYLEADEYKEHSQAIDRITDDIGLELTYDTKMGARGLAVNWPLYTLGGLVLIISLILMWMLNKRFDPVPEVVGTKPKDLGGWLILPLLGLLFTPIRLVFLMLSEDGTWFDYDMISNLLDLGGEYTALSILVVFEMIFNIFFIAFSVLLIYQFFKRRSSVRALMVTFYTVNLVVLLIDLVVLSFVNDTVAVIDMQMRAETSSELLGSFIATVIWAPYFWFSKRSKETFVVRLKLHSDEGMPAEQEYYRPSRL